MCTYATERVTVRGSVKVAGRWQGLSRVSVYLDHPAVSLADHTLNIDLFTDGHPVRLVALELTPEGAKDLVRAVTNALTSAPREHGHSQGGAHPMARDPVQIT